jgi:hypothetical protein
MDSINEYKLDSNITQYGDMLVPFSSESYSWAKMCGKQPIFKGEKYYWMINNEFLGRKCSEAMVSAVNNIILKIAFRYHDVMDDERQQIRNRLNHYVANNLGVHREKFEISCDHQLRIWDTSFGNLVLDFDGNDSEIILTSRSIRYQKTKSFINNILRN